MISHLNYLKENQRAYFMVDDLTHLQRGGRLNGAQAFYWKPLKGKAYLAF